MKTALFQSYEFAHLNAIALLIFMGLFLVFIFRTYSKKQKPVYDTVAQFPLEDDPR